MARWFEGPDRLSYPSLPRSEPSPGGPLPPATPGRPTRMLPASDFPLPLGANPMPAMFGTRITLFTLALVAAFALSVRPVSAQPTPDQQATMLLEAGKKAYNDAN